MFLNLIIAFSMVYVANKSRDFEKLNNTLLNKINDTNEDLNINLIEYTIHHNYDYLQTLHSIYFENYTINAVIFLFFNTSFCSNFSIFYGSIFKRIII